MVYKVIALLLGLAFKVTDARMYCVDALCSNCSTGILYRRVQCIDHCPFPQKKNANPCFYYIEPLFNLKFYTQSGYSLNSYNGFNTSGNIPFNSESRMTPIPTVDQGFYFQSNSFISNITSKLLSNDFAVRLSGMFKADGTIFELFCSGISKLKVSVNGLLIQADYRLLSETLFTYKSISVGFNSTHWDSIIFYITHQNLQGVSIEMSSSIVLNRITVSDLEYRSCRGDTELVFGSAIGNSFRGFLFESTFLSGGNRFVAFAYRTSCLCDFNQYCDSSSQCIDCNSTCTIWPWCIRNSCNVCFSSSCVNCTAYDFLSCTKCNDSSKTPPDCMCAMHCISCQTTFECTECEPGYININSKCLNEPYNYFTVGEKYPIVNYVFRTFEQYKFDIFQSGADPNTWYPYNQSQDDPLVLPYRGLLVNWNRILKTKQGIFLNLNYKFTVGIWYDSDATNLIDFGNFVFKRLARFSITLSGQDTCTIVNQAHSNPNNAGWVYTSISVNFENQATTIRVINNFDVEILYSMAGFIYISNNDTVKITTSSTIFLYSITIYHDYVSLDQNNPERNEFKSNCNEGTYYNFYESTCRICNVPSNCHNWATANYCLYPDCSSCFSWDEECTRDSATNCSDSFRYTSGKCCDFSCTDCFDYHRFSCLSCDQSKFLLEAVCTDQCPTGYKAQNSKCVIVDSLLFSAVFSSITFTFPDSTLKYNFNLGNDSVSFPNLNPSHPIPAQSRGFYFRNTSYMTVTNIRLSCNFALHFIIKVQGDGSLLTKGDFLFLFSGQNFYFYNSSTPNQNINFGFVYNVWHEVKIKIWVSMKAEEVFQVYVDKSWYNGVISEPNAYLDQSFSNLTIGKDIASFTGFLYEIQLVNENKFITKGFSLCTLYADSLCVSDCDIGMYLNNGQCLPCNACDYGCVRNLVCELCKDPLCIKCENFEYGCLTCKSNSTYNSTHCVCDSKYFYNPATYTCDHCASNCQGCIDQQTCFCFIHSHNENLSCVCDDGYWMNYEGRCIICDPYCETCTTDLYYRCLSCSNYLLGPVCVNECPYGYEASLHTCIPGPNALALRFRFNRLDGVFYDQDKNIRLSHGNDKYFYPFLDSNDPWPAIGRGLYFTGKSVIGLAGKAKSFLLSNQFSISFWVKLSKLSGTLVYMVGDLTELMKVRIQEKVHLKMFLDEHLEIEFKNGIKEGLWGLVALVVRYVNETSAALVFNDQVEEWRTFTEVPFNSSNKLGIGNSPDLDDGVVGFLFEVAVFKEPVSFSLNFSDSCGFFPEDYTCLSACEIGTFPPDCGNCSGCEKGCRDESTCNLCDDPNCLECRDYSNGTCNSCKDGFRLYKTLCVEVCKVHEYFDQESIKCRECPELCLSCLSPSTCYNCSQNSHLNLKKVCECNLGFQGKTNCIQIYFTMSLIINLQDDITLLFSEEIQTEIDESYFKVQINSKSQSFTLSSFNSSALTIKISFKEDVNPKDTLSIQIKKKVYSKKFSLLVNSELSAELFPLTIQQASIDLSKLELATDRGMMAGTALCVGLSLVNMDFKSYLHFRNSAEIFSSIILFDIELSPTILAFLSRIHYSSTLPSFLSSLVDTNKGVELDSKFINYGYRSNFVLLNSGMYFMTFILLCLGYIIAKLMDKGNSNKMSQKLLEYLEFDAFLKLWLQGYLELTLCSIIGIMNNEMSNGVQFVDLIFCYCVLVKAI